MAIQIDRLRKALAGRYNIQREIARGGMATVYLARDLRHDRAVAIKVLNSELAAVLGSERFFREITLTARLDHPHILALLDSGEADGILYYVMPYVEGESLRDRLSREKQLPLDTAVGITRQVADALSYAHSQGIVHRDIKPENILLAAGHARVMDFGIARAITAAREDVLTGTGLAIGTLAYMSPEQSAGDRGVDARTDVYSLGCVVYEMLAGQPPFTGATPEALLARKSEGAVPSLKVVRDTVSARVEQTIAMSLARVPADRFETASQFADALDRAKAVPEAALRTRAPSHQLRLLIAGVVTAAVLAGAWWIAKRVTAPSSRTDSVAVLPFTNVGSDTADTYFADGITDELITALAKVPGLHVAGRSSAFRFRGKANDAQEVGRVLNVASVLEGTVRRDGRRIRVTTQLTNLADGLVIWSESYQRELKDVFSMQDDITRAIVSALQVRLATGGQPGRPSAMAAEPQAYDLYLKGLYLLQRRGQWIPNAIAYFEQAIRKDSTFARAYAQLAISLALLPLYNPVPIDSVSARTRAVADRSILLDSTIAEAHVALGMWYHEGLQGEKADIEYQRALALDPNYPLAYHGRANVLQDQGRYEEAVALTQRALQGDPVSPISLSLHTRALVIARQFPEARLAARRAADLDSLFPFALPQLAAAEYFTGHLREARSAALAAIPVPTTAGQLAWILAATEDRASARLRARNLEKDRGRTSFAESTVSLAYLGAGDTARALDALERAADIHEPLSFSLSLSHPMFDLLRNSPRFSEVARMYGVSVPRSAAH